MKATGGRRVTTAEVHTGGGSGVEGGGGMTKGALCLPNKSFPIVLS